MPTSARSVPDAWMGVSVDAIPRMKRMLKQKYPNVEKLVSKRYWLLWLFSVLGMNEQQMQKMMKSMMKQIFGMKLQPRQ